MFHLVLLLAAALPWAAGEVIAKTMIGSISYTVSRETDAGEGCGCYHQGELNNNLLPSL